MNESFSKEFLDLLSLLNHEVASTGELVEGNCFYKHKDPIFPRAEIQGYTAVKRANLLAATLGRGRVLEIGVNAGHAALLMLHHHPTLHYTGVDIGQYRYTAKAIAFLKERFPGRVDYYAGDSVHVLPKMLQDQSPAAFDIVHIDGLHTTFHCEQDFQHAAKLCVRYAWMIIDDTDMKNIRELHARLITEKKLLPKAPEGWVQNPHHEIGMLPI